MGGQFNYKSIYLDKYTYMLIYWMYNYFLKNKAMKKINEVWTDIEGNAWNNKQTLWEKVILLTDNVHKSAENINNWSISKEKLEAINDNLSEIQKNTIWLDILGLESMTIEKITVIGYMLSAENIMDIWVEELAKIDINELNELTKKYM